MIDFNFENTVLFHGGFENIINKDGRPPLIFFDSSVGGHEYSSNLHVIRGSIYPFSRTVAEVVKRVGVVKVAGKELVGSPIGRRSHTGNIGV